MQQVLHLMIVDPDSCAALVTSHGNRWLLPILSCPERLRAGLLIRRWTAERGITGPVVGQWLGRAVPSRDDVDWLVVVRASARRSADQSAGLRWVPLACLESRVSLLEYQHWAVGTAMGTRALPSIPGPFGTMWWMDEVLAWVRSVIGERELGPTGEIVPHRTTAYNVVLQIPTRSGALYFKGVSADRSDETITMWRLSELLPKAFPSTCAARTLSDGSVWWLMEECPGTPLTVTPVTPERAARVAVAYARLQQELARRLGSDSVPPVRQLEIARMVVWAEALLADACTPAEAARYGDVIRRACWRACRREVPRGWIFTDLDPANVLVHDEQVRFIDLGDARIGPAPIALSTFARRLRRLGVPSDGPYGAYEAAWTPALSLRHEWPVFELLSCLFECYGSWMRVVVKDQRGETHGLLERLRTRLAKRLVAEASRSACEDP